MMRTFTTLGLLLFCCLGACDREKGKTSRETAISGEATGVMGDCGDFLSERIAAGDSASLFEAIKGFAKTGRLRGVTKAPPQGRYVEVQVLGEAGKASVVYITSPRIPGAVFVADRNECRRWADWELKRFNHPKTLLERFYIEHTTAMDLHPEITE
jgi:hypothetical protein